MCVCQCVCRVEEEEEEEPWNITRLFLLMLLPQCFKQRKRERNYGCTQISHITLLIFERRRRRRRRREDLLRLLISRSLLALPLVFYYFFFLFKTLFFVCVFPSSCAAAKRREEKRREEKSLVRSARKQIYDLFACSSSNGRLYTRRHVAKPCFIFSHLIPSRAAEMSLVTPHHTTPQHSTNNL